MLDGASARGIPVVLGNQTFAVPPWMARRRPEIAVDTVLGTSTFWGERQEVAFTRPAYRFYAKRVTRASMRRHRLSARADLWTLNGNLQREYDLALPCGTPPSARGHRALRRERRRPPC